MGVISLLLAGVSNLVDTRLRFVLWGSCLTLSNLCWAKRRTLQLRTPSKDWFLLGCLLFSSAAYASDTILIQSGHLFRHHGTSQVGLATNLYSVLDVRESWDATSVLLTAKNTSSDHWQIFELSLDGGQARQITNCNADCVHGAYLPEGAIAFTVRSSKESYLAVVQPDGSNTERITFGPGNFDLQGVLPDGRILFLHNNQLSVVRPDGTGLESIYCNHKRQGVLHETHSHQIDVTATARPRRLWSTLNPPLGVGHLICLDSRISSPDIGSTLKTAASVIHVQALAADGTVINLGDAPVESDGSFFVAVKADQPVRFELIDNHGVSVRAQKSWIWVRSGEERGCVGCHAEKALSPQNHWPLTLKRFDTPTPVTGATNGK